MLKNVMFGVSVLRVPRDAHGGDHLGGGAARRGRRDRDVIGFFDQPGRQGRPPKSHVGGPTGQLHLAVVRRRHLPAGVPGMLVG